MLYPTHIISSVIIVFLTGLPPLPVLIGSGVPDVIDKPLPKLGVANTYHTVAHSVILPFALGIASIYHQFLFAVCIGWFFHLFLDLVHVVTNGRAKHWRFLAWPIVFQKDPLLQPPGTFFRNYIGTLSFFIDIVIWIVSISILVFWFI